MDETGYIKLYRSIQNHWIWQDQKHLHWWATILLNVNYEPKQFEVNGELFDSKPGESFRSVESWSKLFSCSKATAYKFFKLLERNGMIETRTVGKGKRRKHLLTVTNWQKYQQTKNDNYTINEPETKPEIATNKKDKKERIERGGKTKRFSPPSIQEIQSDFESKTAAKNLRLDAKLEAEKFESFYSAKNWMVGRNKMVNWRKAVSGWIARLQTDSSDIEKPVYEPAKGLKR